MSELYHRLPSGRVLLLEKPLTPEELAEANSERGVAVLESLADAIAARATQSVDSESEQGREILARHIPDQ